MIHEFHLSVTPVGVNEYLVRTEKVAPGVPLAEEQFTWPVDTWLAQARELLDDPLLGGWMEQGKATPNAPNLTSLGQQLCNALFQGAIRDSWVMAQGIAQHRREMLRLRLGLKGSQLARLPWECLHDGDRPLATGADVLFSRYQPIFSLMKSPLSVQEMGANQPLRILMVIAAPTDQEGLALKQEALHLQEELQQAAQNGNPGLVTDIQLSILEQPGREQLTQALEQGNYQVLHYAGHSNLGAAGGALYLVSGRTGLTEILSGDDLAGLLVNNGIRMAVFNSCRGASAATNESSDAAGQRNLAEALIRRGIPGVLAMAERIPDEVALTLSRLFYRNLKQGYPVDLSLSRARQGLLSAYGSNQLFWILPTLYLHQEFSGYLTVTHEEETVASPVSSPMGQVVPQSPKQPTQGASTPGRAQGEPAIAVSPQPRSVATNGDVLAAPPPAVPLTLNPGVPLIPPPAPTGNLSSVPTAILDAPCLQPNVYPPINGAIVNGAIAAPVDAAVPVPLEMAIPQEPSLLFDDFNTRKTAFEWDDDASPMEMPVAASAMPHLLQQLSDSQQIEELQEDELMVAALSSESLLPNAPQPQSPQLVYQDWPEDSFYLQLLTPTASSPVRSNSVAVGSAISGSNSGSNSGSSSGSQAGSGSHNLNGRSSTKSVTASSRQATPVQDAAQQVALHQRAIATNPRNADAHYHLGLALAEQGNLPAAIAAYDQAIQLQPDLIVAYEQLAITLDKQAQATVAIAAYDQAIAAYNRAAVVYNDLGRVLCNRGDLNRAMDVYGQAITAYNQAAAVHNTKVAAGQTVSPTTSAPSQRGTRSDETGSTPATHASSAQPADTVASRSPKWPSGLPLQPLVAGAVTAAIAVIGLSIAFQQEWHFSQPSASPSLSIQPSTSTSPLASPLADPDSKKVASPSPATTPSLIPSPAPIAKANPNPDLRTPEGQKQVKQFLDEGKLADAAASLTAAASVDHPAVHFLEGRLMLQSIRAGKSDYTLKNAQAELEKAVRNTADPTAHNALGFVYYAQGDLNAANRTWFKVARFREEVGVEPSQDPAALMAMAGWALVFQKEAGNQPAAQQQALLNQALALRDQVLAAKPSEFQPEVLAKNWMWPEQAVNDWRSLLARK